MARHPGCRVKIRIDDRLPFLDATLQFAGRQITLQQILVDTGSAGSVFSADAVDPLGIEPERTDRIRRIFGVGGSEYVYSKRVERLALDQM